MLAVAAVAVASFAAPASAASLYDGAGPRPGPDILYADAPRAPQLENTGDWRAAPVLVSGATSYRNGEFVYQDFLYDDHGARGSRRDPNDPRSSGDTFSAPNGTYTYPTQAAYAGNAADLVELRVKPVAGATLFRLTLNTLLDPELTAATIAIGDSPAALPMPFGANARVPAQLFLTWHGSTAVLTDPTGTPVTPAPTVAVDLERRQVELRVPSAAFDPGTGTVKLAAGVGLWDRANDKYLLPGDSATASTPGGAAGIAAPPAFFNLAFRSNDQEPKTNIGDIAEAFDHPAYWRDRAQAQALGTGDISPFRAEVDFGKLAAGTNDDAGVPQSGAMNRILASRFETKQGTDYSTVCGTRTECKGELRGQLQPYSLYIPSKKGPGGYGLTLLLHSLAANYNQFTGTRNQSQFGERGPGSLVVTPSGRGPDGWYYDHAGADTFEVWADVARRFPIDPAYTAIAGYSMGGYGTYKFSTQFPDLFARAQPTVGPPGLGIATTPDNPTGGRSTSTFPMLASLRNVPIMIWDGTTDQLVPFQGVQLQARGLDAIDYRYEFWAFAPADHFTLAVNDQYAPAAAFLGDARVDRDPAHVTYVRNPTMDFPDAGTTANHAYWLSNVEVSDASGDPPVGTIDVRSEGFGTGDPAATGTLNDAGTLTGGNLPAIGYQRQRKEWGATPPVAKRNRLVIDAKNIATVTINPKRAHVTCAAELAVTSDSPVVVRLAGCGTGRTFGQSAACGAKGRPRSSLSRNGLVASRRGLSVAGRAIAFRCLRSSRRRLPGTVARVEVAVARKVGTKCSFLNSRGKLGRPRSCDRNDWLRARLGRQRAGKVPWTFRTSAQLPAGTYEVRVRAIDRTGTVERQPRKQGRKTVRIR
ncbi:MAG: hypothetical protein QOJ12_990 [Thermoleophilales bacterium]|nr:hypothetical protein [Thermoleophilales bacterium]